MRDVSNKDTNNINIFTIICPLFYPCGCQAFKVLVIGRAIVGFTKNRTFN